jgi:hypothetical protein
MENVDAQGGMLRVRKNRSAAMFRFEATSGVLTAASFLEALTKPGQAPSLAP